MATSSSKQLTDMEIATAIRELVPTVDLEQTGVKKFVKLLEKRLDCDLSAHKDFIKEDLTKAINEIDQDDDDEDQDQEGDSISEEEDDDDDEEEAPSKKTLKKKKKGGGSGFGGEKELSPELAAFVKADKMTRTQVVKSMWEYIRQHDLQNPQNRQEILLDATMKKVFGKNVDKFTMFTMNKYIGAHIHPFKPVDLTTNTTTTKRNSNNDSKAEEEVVLGRGSKRKAAPKPKRSSTTTTPTKKKKGSQPPYRLSDDLAAVVGAEILPRPQVVSKLWDYIRSNNLQNPKDKRQIVCDEALKRVMGKAKVTMFSMNALIGRHLIEKLDKSEYQHDQEEGADGDGDDASE